MSRGTETRCRLPTWDVAYWSSCESCLAGLWKVSFHHSPLIGISDKRSLNGPKTFLRLEFEDQSPKLPDNAVKTIPPLRQADVQTQCPNGGSALFKTSQG